MSILVFGRNGQLASDLQTIAAARGISLTALGRNEVDACDRDALLRAIDQVKPQALINAAAYTNVDAAENDAEAAFRLNEIVPRAMAEAAQQAHLPFLHVSTDQVFDGTKKGAYTEADTTNPINLYGRSKLAGEVAVANADPDATIVRVSWVWGPSADNFVKKLLQWAKARNELSIVSDQIGRPTFSPALADALLTMAAMKERPCGILNYAGGDAMTRSDQARIVLDASRALGGPFAKVNDVPTSAFPTPAQRPLNAELDVSKAEALGFMLPTFSDSLKSCMAAIVKG
jgi:dTDP-4-dehydrorhamnose reductase